MRELKSLKTQGPARTRGMRQIRAEDSPLDRQALTSAVTPGALLVSWLPSAGAAFGSEQGFSTIKKKRNYEA